MLGRRHFPPCTRAPACHARPALTFDLLTFTSPPVSLLPARMQFIEKPYLIVSLVDELNVLIPTPVQYCTTLHAGSRHLFSTRATCGAGHFCSMVLVFQPPRATMACLLRFCGSWGLPRSHSVLCWPAQHFLRSMRCETLGHRIGPRAWRPWRWWRWWHSGSWRSAK